MTARVNPPSVDIEMKNHGLSRVGWIWINRPVDGNVIDRSMVQEIIRAVASLNKNPEVRVIVLAARGESFSCGIESGWLRAQASASMSDALDDTRKLAQLLQVLAECEKPTIARVQGNAVGIGAGMIAACDIGIAADHVRFTMVDDNLGMAPAVITPHLVRAIGARQCQRYFQTSEQLTAARAAELGLVHEVVAPEALDEHITALIASLLLGDAQAQQASSKLIRAIAIAPGSVDMTADAVRVGARLRAGPSLRARMALPVERPFLSVHRVVLDEWMREAD